MKKLSREAFDRARDFIKAQARPLDRVLFEYRFEGAPVDLVTAELARFQNDDGGFGHALEPDLRTPTSSALATEIGTGFFDAGTVAETSPIDGVVTRLNVEEGEIVEEGTHESLLARQGRYYSLWQRQAAEDGEAAA